MQQAAEGAGLPKIYLRRRREAYLSSEQLWSVDKYWKKQQGLEALRVFCVGVMSCCVGVEALVIPCNLLNINLLLIRLSCSRGLV